MPDDTKFEKMWLSHSSRLYSTINAICMPQLNGESNLISFPAMLMVPICFAYNRRDEGSGKPCAVIEGSIVWLRLPLTDSKVGLPDSKPYSGSNHYTTTAHYGLVYWLSSEHLSCYKMPTCHHCINLPVRSEESKGLCSTWFHIPL